MKSESEVAQSCLTLSDPMYCSLPGSSIHGIFQARVLEWDAIAFSSHKLPANDSVSILYLNVYFGLNLTKNTFQASLCSLRMKHTFQNITSKALKAHTSFYLSCLFASLPPATENFSQFLLVISWPFR